MLGRDGDGQIGRTDSVYYAIPPDSTPEAAQKIREEWAVAIVAALNEKGWNAVEFGEKPSADDGTIYLDAKIIRGDMLWDDGDALEAYYKRHPVEP